MEKSRILIIEDNADTLRFLEAMLGQEFEIISTENAILGIDYARNKNPNLILLDNMLPVLSGYDICSLLKKDEKTKRIPIIFLSGRNTVADITRGFAAGADDYIPKPFDYKELLTRIKMRLFKSAEMNSQPIQVGDLRIDPSNREVSFAGKKAQLTLTEFDILRYLASKYGNIISREEILKEVWQDNSKGTTDRTIDVHVRALRKKIPELTKHIISIYGVGYKYDL
jgi:two-component system, OmpR family, alkaline phosphatase synthesis response regulator PhoP